MMDRNALLSQLSAFNRDCTLAGVAEVNRAWRSIANALERIERALARPARLAVFGEEKTGKSSLINFLLKRQVLPSGGLPGQGTYMIARFAHEPAMYAVAPDGNKTRLTSKAMSFFTASTVVPSKPPGAVVYDASNPSRPSLHAGRVAAHLMSNAHSTQSDTGRLIELVFPQQFLREIELLEARDYPRDCPAPPVARAFRFIDIAVWCTLSTQAWKESERAAWRAIPAGQRRFAAMVVTYKDAVRNTTDEKKILTRLHNEARGVFNTILLASVRDALAAELVPGEEEAARLRDAANAGMVEEAIDALVKDWRHDRAQKVVRLLERISVRLHDMAKRQNDAVARDFAQRLERIVEKHS